MTIHLVNPSHVSFGIGVITPRWLYVLAAATPASYGVPAIVDETLEPIDPATIKSGDIVGIGIHTGNALRGYELGMAAHRAGATVIYGGIHATLYPDEARAMRLLQGAGLEVVNPEVRRGLRVILAERPPGAVAPGLHAQHEDTAAVGEDRCGLPGGLAGPVEPEVP